MSTTPFPASIPERYHIIGQLGESRVATVCRADDQRLHRYVLLHVFRTAQPSQAQLAQRQHFANRGLLSVYDSGTRNGRPFLVTEDVTGQPLAQSTPLAPEHALATVRAVIDTVNDAQAQQVAHPALNSRNVWLMEHGRVVLLEDWNMPLAALPQLDAPYRAPELQPGTSASTASTVYALGALLREAFTGSPTGQQRGLAQLSPQLAQIIARAMARDPHQRYATIGEMALALDNYAASLSAQTEHMPSPTAAPTIAQPTYMPLRRTKVMQAPPPLVAVPAVAAPARVPPPPQTSVMASPPPTVDAPADAPPRARRQWLKRTGRTTFPARWRRALLRVGLRLARAAAILAVLFFGARYIYDTAASRARSFDPAEWARTQVPTIDIGGWIDQHTPNIHVGQWLQRQLSNIGDDLSQQVRNIRADGTTYRVTQSINLRSKPSTDNGAVLQRLSAGTRIQQHGAPRDDAAGQSIQWIQVTVLDNNDQRDGWVALLNDRLEPEQ